MSNWDFRFTGRPADHRDTRQSREDMATGEAGADPYPLTYERGWPDQATPQPASQPDQPWPPAPFPGDEFGADEFQTGPFQAGALPGDQFPPGQVPGDAFAGGEVPAAPASTGPFAADPWPEPAGARQWPPGGGEDEFTRVWPSPALGTDAGADPGAGFGAESGASFDERQWPPGRNGRKRRNRRIADLSSGRRWMVLAGIAGAGTAVGVAAVLLTSGHPSATSATVPPAPFTAPPSASPSPSHPAASSPAAATRPITLAAAENVVAGYTTANNSANAQRSNARLATIETASSLAIDAGLYRVQQAAGVRPYPAFGPVNATYYIPRAEPGGGPRWFAVQVSNAFFSNPGKATSTEYLLFTQATPGGPWRNAIEPYVLPGATAPQVAVGSDGMATAVSTTATSVAIQPGQLAASTAASLDGAGTAVAGPSDLADQSDQRFWHGKLPTTTITDTHAPATGTAGQSFALLTTGGGALVFYADAAQLSLTPPAGTMLHLTVPSLYSPAQALSGAGLTYLDQFAAYDPPTGKGPARVIADYSGLTGKN